MTPAASSDVQCCGHRNEVFRSDYECPTYGIKETNLDLQLDFEKTKVKTVLRMYRNKSAPAFADLVLNGDKTIKLESIQLQREKQEPQTLQQDKHFRILSDEAKLTIEGSLLPETPDEMFTVTMAMSVNPSTNTELMGLYKAGPILCTQMEAEGFRRLTYSLDRPDVLSKFRVRLEACKATFPVLLSNGNRVEEGDLSDKRHFAVFDDPFPKPAYLFAVVAGDLHSKEDSFTRCTGKPVRLSIWCEPKDSQKLDWAMECVKKSMKWDEERFGRVYDLDWFNIVACSYFNMGAMENKSLNIFNASLLLGHKDVSTDEDFLRIAGVIAHEYFHNWTGNRVTCRDWFQLTLKEGLTIYRDQSFSKDLCQSPVERIKNILMLRSLQFVEDSGPLAHPIRPDSYEKIDNFYTMTVYRKGSEVIGMYKSILGAEGFRKGMDLYFDRHDGQAVTCDDFRAAMSNATGVDLTQFERWYSQAGTPVVTIESTKYDEKNKQFTISLKQDCGPSPKQPTKLPFHIPVAVGLVGRNSAKEIFPTKILQFTEERQTFVLDGVEENPVLSIFRDFSAPVKLVSDLQDSDYGLLMTADTDGFNRWDAAQKLLSKVILDRAKQYRDGTGEVGSVMTPTLQLVLNGFKSILKMVEDRNADLYYIAFMLLLPPVSSLMQDFVPCDPPAISKARKDVRVFLAKELQTDLTAIYDSLTKKTSARKWDLSMESVGIRALRNRVLGFLTAATGKTDLVVEHYNDAGNMNDRLAALVVMVDYPSEATSKSIENFLARAEGDESIVDKWFHIQACADHEGVVDRVKELKKHKLFNMLNPNRVRSLASSFTTNLAHFHRSDGEGYCFVGGIVGELDKINGRIAARLASSLTNWKHMTAGRQDLIKEELRKLSSVDLSEQCKEVVAKGLHVE